MDWFSFWLNSITLLSQGCLLLCFSACLSGKRRNWRHFAVFLSLLYCTTPLRSNILEIGAELFVLYGANRFLLGNSRPVSCVTTVIAVYVAQLSFGILNPLESLLFPHISGRMPLVYLLVGLATLFSLFLCGFCYWLILKRFTLRDDRLEPYAWMLFPPGVFFIAVEFYILHTVYGSVVSVPYPVEPVKHLALLILQLLGLGALFSALYAFERTCAGFQAQSSLNTLAQEAHAQKSYVAEAQMRYDQTRAFRHDIKNHLSVLNGLLTDGNVAQAQTYLQKLEVVTTELSCPVCTGNPIVDVLLRDKLKLAETSGATVELNLVLPKPCGVDDLDLCVIFANALDNAIQACRQMEGPKWLHIRGERQGDFYLLKFENTCSAHGSKTMGTGLNNVKAVAEKYRGAMTIENDLSRYHLCVLLNISIHLDDSSRHAP